MTCTRPQAERQIPLATRASSTHDPKLPRKQLELLRQVVPNAKRIAFLGDEVLPAHVFTPHEDAARALGLEPLTLKVGPPNPDLDGAFEKMQREGVEALVMLQHPITALHRMKIGELAAKFRLPSLFPPGRLDAGGLLNYGTSFDVMSKPAAEYVDRILKGAKPGELPVRALLDDKLVINLKTAEALTVTIPPSILDEAAEVIR